jgi:hypothetical protein
MKCTILKVCQPVETDTNVESRSTKRCEVVLESFRQRKRFLMRGREVRIQTGKAMRSCDWKLTAHSIDWLQDMRLSESNASCN